MSVSILRVIEFHQVLTLSCLHSQGALLQSMDSTLEPGKRAKVLEVKGSSMLGGNKTILILPSGEHNFLL